MYERDPVCEWCGSECARVRASQHAVYERGTACERDSVCEDAVCEGDDGWHAGARSRVSESECNGEVCESRDTREFERVG